MNNLNELKRIAENSKVDFEMLKLAIYDIEYETGYHRNPEADYSVISDFNKDYYTVNFDKNGDEILHYMDSCDKEAAVRLKDRHLLDEEELAELF